jgi:hypothetical protein
MILLLKTTPYPQREENDGPQKNGNKIRERKI